LSVVGFASASHLRSTKGTNNGHNGGGEKKKEKNEEE